MINENKMNAAQSIIDRLNGANTTNVKRIRKDNSIIERVQTEKIILTEDNKQLLFG